MVDFIVIGAGVYGTATAWSLAQAGASVRIVDACSVATRASGGPGRRGVRANGRDVRELPLMRRAYDIWPTLHERLAAAPFYERVGQLLLAETELDWERAQARTWMQQRQGIRTELLAADALKELEPNLHADIRGALYCPLDGVADHTATTLAYAAAAQKLGVEITTDTAIQSIESNSKRATAVVTADGERIAASRGILVLANSAAAVLISPWARLPVWNECLQVIVSKPIEPVPFRHLTGHLSRTVSLKVQAGSRVMVSGGWHGHWDAARAAGVAIDTAITANLAQAAAVYPALELLEAEVADASHLESFSIDAIPVIDSVADLPNLWFACGWCGHGWAIAPVIAELLAQWALEGAMPQLLQPFGMHRFG